MPATGWSVAAVPALISFDHFFALLADRRFPVATFIRRRDELDYLQEPDIFHEIFGHCAMLTNPAFAHFTHLYGRLGRHASKEERVYLARLYWFTVEFGLLQGGGAAHLRRRHSLLHRRDRLCPLGQARAATLRSAGDPAYPYRIDIMQPTYFVLPRLDTLYGLEGRGIMAAVAEARRLGLRPPCFAPIAGKQAS